jgi:hypothetical protein
MLQIDILVLCFDVVGTLKPVGRRYETARQSCENALPELDLS